MSGIKRNSSGKMRLQSSERHAFKKRGTTEQRFLDPWKGARTNQLQLFHILENMTGTRGGYSERGRHLSRERRGFERLESTRPLTSARPPLRKKRLRGHGWLLQEPSGQRSKLLKTGRQRHKGWKISEVGGLLMRLMKRKRSKDCEGWGSKTGGVENRIGGERKLRKRGSESWQVENGGREKGMAFWNPLIQKTLSGIALQVQSALAIFQGPAKGVGGASLGAKLSVPVRFAGKGRKIGRPQ